MASPYLHPATQRQHLVALSQQAQREHAAVLEAYQQWAASDFGQVILDDLVSKVLLVPCTTERDEGKRLLVLEMLALMREASTRLQHLRQGETG